ncbi:hypothetical protein Ahy_A09g043675 [Arachis hypogaea]|uniref:NADP-dependent oxidoreductase domain-containing protein n=1 Tax=Arachis hypogaea TaxID=3818 RepID=A0A445BIW5_ARAHY|nr:hypothetical protein Ahy_A09g043675 [Arachis hypogaea]
MICFPFDIEGTWEAMEECQRLGLAKFIGVEMSSSWQQGKLKEFCKQKGIHLAAWSPLGSYTKSWGLQNLALLNLEGCFVTAVCLDTLAGVERLCDNSLWPQLLQILFGECLFWQKLYQKEGKRRNCICSVQCKQIKEEVDEQILSSFSHTSAYVSYSEKVKASSSSSAVPLPPPPPPPSMSSDEDEDDTEDYS